MTISLHDMFPGARSVWCDCLAPGYAAYARHGEVFGRGGTVFSPGWLAETIESLLIPIGRAVVLRLDRVPHPLRVAVMDFLLDRVRSVALENCGARGRWRSPDAASAVATRVAMLLMLGVVAHDLSTALETLPRAVLPGCVHPFFKTDESRTNLVLYLQRVSIAADSDLGFDVMVSAQA